jgi:hypothetical protein
MRSINVLSEITAEATVHVHRIAPAVCLSRPSVLTVMSLPAARLPGSVFVYCFSHLSVFDRRGHFQERNPRV